ncbi:hypothetical protein GCM10007079_42420 [Nocardiopsis terrae]|uniref:Secreted protein n=1 Tax=Nocardiopsis terrae TaxID=372655 RepID=A0ABR9HLT8_9ACTN|nr:hypothetical protein [Nocardiopsis terrae]MBE1459941.1 hypothetical protein [Nocardiopsis terrae]GHC93230.1 hypothetical protein GCM10007079_42420 [Nocardiopsis terrae]
MQILLALIAVLAVPVRLARPTRGLHASSYGYVWGLTSEVRRRSRRVRRYAHNLPEAVRTCCA